jgi:hypothetical protein
MAPGTAPPGNSMCAAVLNWRHDRSQGCSRASADAPPPGMGTGAEDDAAAALARSHRSLAAHPGYSNPLLQRLYSGALCMVVWIQCHELSVQQVGDMPPPAPVGAPLPVLCRGPEALTGRRNLKTKSSSLEFSSLSIHLSSKICTEPSTAMRPMPSFAKAAPAVACAASMQGRVHTRIAAPVSCEP